MWLSSLWRPRRLADSCQVLPQRLGVSLEVPFGVAPETRDFRGFPQCAREDSNLHGPYSPQGPQPCASTNSATGAWAASIALDVRSRGTWGRRARGPGRRFQRWLGVRLSPSVARARFTNTCSTAAERADPEKELTVWT